MANAEAAPIVSSGRMNERKMNEESNVRRGKKTKKKLFYRKDKSEIPVLSDFSFLVESVRNALWIIQASWWRIWGIKHLNFLWNIIPFKFNFFPLSLSLSFTFRNGSQSLWLTHDRPGNSCRYERHKILVSKCYNLYHGVLSLSPSPHFST